MSFNSVRMTAPFGNVTLASAAANNWPLPCATETRPMPPSPSNSMASRRDKSGEWILSFMRSSFLQWPAGAHTPGARLPARRRHGRRRDAALHSDFRVLAQGWPQALRTGDGRPPPLDSSSIERGAATNVNAVCL